MTVLDDSPGTVEPPSPGRRRIAPVVVGVLAVVMVGLFVVLIGADPDEAATAESPLIGRPAPEAVGELDDGRPFDLSRRKGSWVVLNFFTSDCRPCIAEHPELITFVDQQRALGANGAEFYSVVVADSRERVEAFFAERGGDWPVIYPADGSTMDVAFGVSMVPETWVIDPNGFVRARIISETSAEQLGLVLRQLREGAS